MQFTVWEAFLIDKTENAVYICKDTSAIYQNDI